MSGYEHEPADGGRIWVGLTTEPLSVDRAAHWVLRPDCGAVVTFAGTVRDHADGREGVDELEYEAYDSQVEPRLRLIAEEAIARWTGVGRVVIWHRVGTLALGETSVLVAVASAHRADAFDAARYCIDTVKTSVPIWKRERWEGGEDWGLDAHDLTGIGADADRAAVVADAGRAAVVADAGRAAVVADAGRAAVVADVGPSEVRR